MPLSVCCIQVLLSWWHVLVILNLLLCVLIFWQHTWLLCQIKCVLPGACHKLLYFLWICIVSHLILVALGVRFPKVTFYFSTCEWVGLAAPDGLLVQRFALATHARESCNRHLCLLSDLVFFLLFCLNLGLCVEPLVWDEGLLVSWTILKLIFANHYGIIHKHIDFSIWWQFVCKVLSLFSWRVGHKVRCENTMGFWAVRRPSVHHFIWVICALEDPFVWHL